MKKLALRTGLAILVVAFALWLGNSSRLVEPIASGPQLLAHRGLGQDFSREGLTGATAPLHRPRLVGPRPREL